MKTRPRLYEILVAVMCLSVTLGGVCRADDASSSVTEQFMKNPDFSKVLAQRERESQSPDSANPQLALRMSKIQNFDIHVGQTPASYTVWFRPTMRDTAHVVMGGGATYTLDRRTFLILKKVQSR